MRGECWNNSRNAAIAACVLALAGCARVFELSEVQLPPPDAPSPDAPWDALGEFGFSAPQRILELASTTTDSEPTLSDDMLEIYFKHSPGTGGPDDIWVATRTAPDAAWSAPSPFQLSTTDYENNPALAPDGLTIWFRRSPAAGGNGTIMKSTRTARGAAWTTPVILTELNTSMGDGQFMSTSPTVAYLTSNRGGGALRIFRSLRPSGTGTWGTPTEVTELKSPTGYNQSPWVTPDDLAIVFSSDRNGVATNGDLWMATRASPSDPFGAPILMSEISREGFDVGPWISRDLRHIVFASNSSGNLDLWEASR